MEPEFRFEGQHLEMIGDSPIALEFNRRQSKYWCDTGRVKPPEETVISILVDDYNSRHAFESKIISQ